ncbi:PIN-like domain-containing protein [Crocosphaera sp. Alani8]|uniref:PIN-like domain-containing protein n=1 Tax=Crocosphaera sp. Alani8 TaxID=3038952 RepID=UPI00406C01D4
MKQHFPGYYRPNEDDFKFLWENCIFVLDTNILLNIYRYPLEARNDLLEILKTISDRLWIPHQVALEYQQNRLKIISEQIQRYRQVRKVIEDSENDLRKSIYYLTKS